MKSFGLKALLLLALLAPVASAQPTPSGRRASTVADTVTGIDQPPPGMEVGVPSLDPAMIRDYVRAVEAMDMAVDFQTAGRTRAQLGVDRLRIESKWERRPGESSARLAGLTLTPVGGRLEMGGFKINKVTIDRDGRMHLDIHNFPNVTVSKITRNERGDVRLHLDWLPDITIRNDGNVKLLGFIGLGNVGGVGGLTPEHWPPRLEDVMAMLQRPSGGSTMPAIEGTVSWDIRSRASSTPFPLAPGLTLPIASDARLRGRGTLGPDGTFRTIGTDNTVTLDLIVGGAGVAVGPVRGDVRSATVHYEGAYGLTASTSGGPFALTIDGGVSYRVEGRNLVVAVPGGTTVTAGEATLVGDTHLNARVAAGRPARAVLRDGHYKLDVRGPIALRGLRAMGVEAEDLGFTGDLHSEGTYTASTGGRSGLNVDGNLTGDLVAERDGVVTVLTGGTRGRGTVRAGSRVEVDLDRVTGHVATGADGRPDPSDGTAHGRIRAGLDVGDIAASTSTGRLAAGRAHVDVDATIDASVEAGLRAASGSARVRLDGEGELAMTTGGAAPGAGRGAGTHVVARGDTLSAIARRYGTTVAALKQANGLASDTIPVGRTLRVPAGGAPARSGPGTVSTRLAAGSELAVVVSSARVGRDGTFEVDGMVSSRLRVNDLDVRNGVLEARILGTARASLDAAFRARRGADRRVAVTTSGTIRVPVRIDLNAGSRLQVHIPGNETDVVIDRAGSYAEFTAVVKSDAAGLRVDELASCDLLLVSTGAARFGGTLAEVPGEKSIRYQGRVVLRSDGLDLYGDITVRVHGPADRPIIRVRW